MVKNKKIATGQTTLLEIIKRFYKAHGIKKPSLYLSKRGGMTRPGFYFLIRSSMNGVGVGVNEDTGGYRLNPRSAVWLIQQADELLTEDELFEPTPIEKFLKPLILKFYAEMKND